ncbi:ATP-binding protein [Actinoallomurus soli]|uniref:ATP-binding protein n=1 Tax=Actinoallomurus soli TaxID=2952535 RepID=UPI002091F868|nr:ATP-binding protein [Actinoallomurus soli]MCO5970896.1 ATP-binding protein [Actinoallomurus soli]
MTERESPPDERLFAFRQLPPAPTAPGEAREWAAKVLARWNLTGVADDLQTAVTESVTNALRAGAGSIHALIEWHWSTDTVELQVWDDAPGRPQPRRPDFVAETGRGLFIVEALSTAWGHHPGADGGKVVWARFTTSTPG